MYGVRDTAPLYVADTQEGYKRKAECVITDTNKMMFKSLVTEWRSRSTVTWDTCSKHVGLDMNSIDLTAGQEEHGSITLVSRSCESIREGAVCRSMAINNVFRISGKVLQMILCGYFAHRRRLRFEDSTTGPFQTITAKFPGSNWSVPVLRIVMQEAMSKVFHLFS